MEKNLHIHKRLTLNCSLSRWNDKHPTVKAGFLSFAEEMNAMLLTFENSDCKNILNRHFSIESVKEIVGYQYMLKARRAVCFKKNRK